MGDQTGIEWADSTWNPTVGCTKVSAGCDHCYAETFVNRFAPSKGFPNRFDTLTIRGEKFLNLPLSKKWAEPRKIFVNSLSDLFHADVPTEHVAAVFATMAVATQHTFQLLTKRHGRMRSLLRNDDFERAVAHAWMRHPLRETYTPWPGWPLPNLWLGVSVEDQAAANLRVPALLDTPAAIRWLSMEPLLGPVDLTHMDVEGRMTGGYWINALTGRNSDMGRPCPDVTSLDWIVVGGESGAGARPMHPKWVRTLRDQCLAAKVPFLFKQWGEWTSVDDESWRDRHETDHDVRIDGYHWPIGEPHGAEDGTEVLMRRVGKKAAGRLLDGRDWTEYPAAAS